MVNDWGSADARPNADPDDVTKYDHLLPIGASRVRQFDQQLRERDQKIIELRTELESLRAQNQRLIETNGEYLNDIAELKSWRWVDSTYALQRNVYGHTLPMQPNTDELADYVQMNLFAAVDEVMEMAGEVGWKPWASPRGWIRPQHIMKEAVDVLHFIANVLCAAGISDDEFWEAYRAKQTVNSERQELGYDGVSGKCPGCRRSYDDGIDCSPVNHKDGASEPAFCTVNNTYVDLEE